MSLILRLFLVAGSAATLIFFITKIRKSKLKINHSIFWGVFGIVLLFLACIPDGVFVVAEWLGVTSPVNLVYLVIIFLLMIKQFNNTIRISKMNEQVASLTQALAIYVKTCDEDKNCVSADLQQSGTEHSGV